MCSMNTRKSIFFSQASVRFLGKFIFFTQTLARVQFYKQLGYIRISSCYGCRYQADNLVDLLIRSSNIIDSTLSCRIFQIKNEREKRILFT